MSKLLTLVNVVGNAGFLLNMEAVVDYPNRVCKVCGEDKNMYGGCRCNKYTTAFNAVENQHIPQKPKNLVFQWRKKANGIMPDSVVEQLGKK